MAPRSADPLWSVEAHEALAGEAWSEAAARAAITAICRDAEEAFDPERLWPAHPLDGEVSDDELLTVYLGGAGMAWALDRLARAGLHEPAHDWAAVAAELAGRAGPLPPSLLLGRAGILLVSWLLRPSAETADLLTLEIAANVGNKTNELLWGSPGTMFAAAALIDQRRRGAVRGAVEPKRRPAHRGARPGRLLDPGHVPPDGSLLRSRPWLRRERTRPAHPAGAPRRRAGARREVRTDRARPRIWHS